MDEKAKANERFLFKDAGPQASLQEKLKSGEIESSTHPSRTREQASKKNSESNISLKTTKLPIINKNVENSFIL